MPVVRQVGERGEMEAFTVSQALYYLRRRGKALLSDEDEDYEQPQPEHEICSPYG